MRQNLTRRFSTMDGVLYDADTVVFEGKDVTFKCCLVTDTIERFWRCYTAFFNDLIRPGERSLGYAGTGRSYGCYYKSTSGWTLAGLSGRVVVEFTLTLAFTAFVASGGSVYLLATEDDFLVSTEDDALVDLSLNRAAAPTGYIVGLDAGVSSGTGGTEVRRRKITEMPEAGALDNIVLMGWTARRTVTCGSRTRGSLKVAVRAISLYCLTTPTSRWATGARTRCTPA